MAKAPSCPPRIAKRIVVKMGTNVICGSYGSIDMERLTVLVAEIAELAKAGKEIMLVSSGAIASGMPMLGLGERPREIELRQACAAVGQGMLMHTYAKLFAKHGITVAQLLVNPDDFADRTKYNALRRVTETLIRKKVIPIINENDAVSTAEMQDVKKKSMSSVSFGDNDVLSALVCSKMGAELLILLTDVDGLYTSNPKKDPNARLIRKVDEKELETVDAEGKGALGRGGMITKLRAAAIATTGGSYVVIANGRKPGTMAGALVCEAGTMFEPKKAMSGREKWIAFAAVPAGRIFLDDKACDVLIHKGASLLPVGVTHLDGKFVKGDVVELMCGNKAVGRGMTNMSSEELDQVKGMHCNEAEGKLGVACKMVINRSNLVMDTGWKSATEKAAVKEV